ncbi:unnamed protein product [Lupinus luteus]|uniref:Uncharacterized protein n=1 Tax=Lupinus luteus TaxID=3873 RepID=A0AAV1X124_LUPLU
MFPSTTYSSISPYPNYFLSSSSSYHPFTFLNPENASANNNTFPHDPSYVPYIIPSTHHHVSMSETPANFEVADNYAAAMFKNDANGSNNFGFSNFLTKKPAAKKDRHSKILTSQGLRDRRVRLSINIARKFFDLQDMLGFDKASKTLEWLFNKSNKAMKDLARSNHHSSNGFANSISSFSSSDSECDEVVSMIKQDSTDATNPQRVVVDSKERKVKRAKMKESREKARARARERTSNKKCNTSIIKKKCPITDNPQMLHELRSPFHHPEDLARSPDNKLIPSHHHHHYHPHLMDTEVARDDFNVIEESIVIKRKLKQSLLSSSHHHQNHVIPNEASSNNNTEHHSFPILSPNWDANNGATSRTNFCAE